jgi:ribosomal protein S18 acetylase RimI-like enzyme
MTTTALLAMTIELTETAPDAPHALALIHELSQRLNAITGDDGRMNFSAASVRSPRARFVVAHLDGQPVGCGALRPVELPDHPQVCEIKRMYARATGQGIGSRILQYLEHHAAALGYRAAWLETRRVNTVAVAFYRGHGYAERENYGVYVGRPDAVCFEKRFGE